MSHLKMLGLLIAIVSMGYFALCLAGNDRIELTESEAKLGSCLGAVEALSRLDKWATFVASPAQVASAENSAKSGRGFRPLGDMTMTFPASSSHDEAVAKLRGAWGDHLLHWTTSIHPTGSCQLNLRMESQHWPLHLRGMAILFGFQGAAQAELDQVLALWLAESEAP